MELRSPTGRHPSILAVEDQRPVLDLLGLLLGSEQIEFHGAINGAEALDKLNKISPDLILLDLSLPDVNGHTLFETIKGLERHRDVPVVFLTGQTAEPHKLRALEAGAVDYITKPFGIEELIARIKTHLRQKFRRDEEHLEAIRVEEQARKSVRQADMRFRALARNSSDLVCEIDQSLLIAYLSPNLTALRNFPPDAAEGRFFLDFIPSEIRAETEAKLKRALASKGEERFETRTQADNSERWIDVAATYFEGDAHDSRLLLVCRDITESKQQEAYLRRLAWMDPLTGMPNRAWIDRELNTILAEPEEAKRCALIYFDMDNFKLVNDTQGHLAGDELLRRFAGVLRGAVRPEHPAARAGGDEFCVILKDVSPEEAIREASQLLETARQTLGSHGEGRFVPTFSMGVAMGESGISLNEWVVRADSALYAAKQHGKNRMVLFTSDSAAMVRLRNEVDWAGKIRDGISHNRFEIWYQPIYTVKKRTLVTHEALMRYRDPDGGIHLPNAFLNAAARYNLLYDLDRHMVQRVLQDLQRTPRLTATINLSGSSVAEPGLTSFLLEKLKDTGVDPSRVSFEITESVFIGNLGNAKELVAQLQAVGCRFALDDFGAGFSSMGYLRNLTVDSVKIDGAFVAGIVDDPVACALFSSINQIAHLLGKQTTAEYVDGEAVLNLLKQQGVDFAQGNYLGFPLPLDHLNI